MLEQTLVMIKPDGVRRKMIGSILSAIESNGMSIKQLQCKILTEDEATELYKEHKGKWHFDRNIKHVTSGPVVVIGVEGKEAVRRCREIVENFRNSHQDVIQLPRNLVHASSESGKVVEELKAVGLA